LSRKKQKKIVYHLQEVGGREKFFHEDSFLGSEEGFPGRKVKEQEKRPSEKSLHIKKGGRLGLSN